MRVYHDWEFLEDSITIKPISVGMVAENGAELYYEFANAPWSDIMRNEWLKQNVIPGLKSNGMIHGNTDDVFKSKLAITNKVNQFLLDVHKQSTTGVELWGWYSSYDHVCLAQLFGKMINLPPYVPMWTNDLRQEFARLGNPVCSLRQDAGTIHNALEDARFLKKKHEWLIGYEHLKARNDVQIGNGNSQVNVF